MRLLAGHRPGQGADALSVMIEEAILAQFAHRHEFVAIPAELVAVELARRRRIARRQLVPTDALFRAWRKDVALGIRIVRRGDRLHHVKWRALRIRYHGNSPDIWNVGRPHIGLAAGLLDRSNAPLDILYVNVAEPRRPRSVLLHLIRERQHAAG